MIIWNILACTRVVARGGIVKVFVANSALEGADWNVTSLVLGSTCSQNFCKKSMPEMFLLESWAICTVCEQQDSAPCSAALSCL